MFVTTCGKVNNEVISKAICTADELSIPYIERKKRSITEHIKKLDSECLVVGKERLELYSKNNKKDPFFFHPNSASFRIKRLIRMEKDPLIEVSELKEGMSFLDCTLGLASDSIIASHIVGDQGEIVGIEANKFISHIVKNGLKTWVSPLNELNEAMLRIKVIHGSFINVLKQLPDNRFNIVYFDPMFEEALTDSHGINPIRSFASYTSLTYDVIKEAKRVAKDKVVLKEHYQSKLFEEFDFDVQKRPSSKFHFGRIEV